MATTSSLTTLLHAHDTGDCPMCGQPLLDRDAVERVEEAKRDIEKQVDSAIQVKAAQLAKQIAKRERDAAEEQIQKLTDQVDSHKETEAKLKRDHTEALAKQKRTHDVEMRELRKAVKAEVATEAEKTAAARVKRDLQRKEKLISDLKEHNEVQARRIEHLTADERGEMNEEELVARLRVAFPEDRIERSGRGRSGSDIVHEIRYLVSDRTEVAGVIVYECKDTLQWNNSFIAQAKKARLTHQTPHVVIASRAFPRKEKTLCVREDVPVVAPTCLIDLARLLRSMVIELHRAGLSKEGQEAKTQELYAYLSDDDF